MTDHEEERGGTSLRSLPSQSTDPTVSTEQTQIHKIIDDVWDLEASLYKSDNNCIRKPNNKLKKKNRRGQLECLEVSRVFNAPLRLVTGVH